MNHPVNPSTKPQSDSDSFFGMALAQAFMGMVYGPLVEQVWEAGEMSSAVYEDRYVDQRANGRVYNLGVKKSLADDFARTSSDRPKQDRVSGDWFAPKPFAAQAERRFAI